MSNIKSVVFSGHREVFSEHVDLIVNHTNKICDTADRVYVGGALGADTTFLSAICDRRQRGKSLPASDIDMPGGADGRIPEVWIVVPARIENQPQEARRAIERAIGCCQAIVIEMDLPYNGESLKKRNHKMIDEACQAGDAKLLVYWRKVYKSGTWSAMHYASKHAVQIEHILQVE